MESETPNDAPNLEAMREQRKDFDRAIGKRITQLRRERRMSQAALGRILGLTQQTVFNIEIGECRLRLERIAVLARAFGVSADDLLGISRCHRRRSNRLRSDCCGIWIHCKR